jgi:hypothetical protein
MALGFVEEHGQAHGTLLQEGRRRAALPKGGKGSDGVVAHHDPGVREVKFSGGGFKGKDSAKGLSANLVEHAVRVGVAYPARTQIPVQDFRETHFYSGSRPGLRARLRPAARSPRNMPAKRRRGSHCVGGFLGIVALACPLVVALLP